MGLEIPLGSLPGGLDAEALGDRAQEVLVALLLHRVDALALVLAHFPAHGKRAHLGLGEILQHDAHVDEARTILGIRHTEEPERGHLLP